MIFYTFTVQRTIASSYNRILFVDAEWPHSSMTPEYETLLPRSIWMSKLTVFTEESILVPEMEGKIMKLHMMKIRFKASSISNRRVSVVMVINHFLPQKIKTNKGSAAQDNNRINTSRIRIKRFIISQGRRTCNAITDQPKCFVVN